MACYKRIYYIDYYENGEKCANVGFLKLIQWRKGDCDGGTNFQIHISECPVKNKGRGEVKLTCGDHDVSLGQVEIISGKGTAQISDLDRVLAVLKKERRDGVLLRVELAAGGYFECELIPAVNISEEDKVLEAAELAKQAEKEAGELAKQAAEEAAELAKQAAEVAAELAKESTEEVTEFVSEGAIPEWKHSVPDVKHDKWHQLWSIIPHICPFEDEREYLRMELRDMVILPKMYYRLTENSFLRHGYYNYGHLILTKVYKRGREKICVGVPGNYYEKEKQVAVMFGFESFEPKTEPAKEGDFGYYMIGVDI